MPTIRNPTGGISKVEPSNDGYKRAIAGEPGWTVLDDLPEVSDTGKAGASAPADSADPLGNDVAPIVPIRKRGRPRKRPEPE